MVEQPGHLWLCDLRQVSFPVWASVCVITQRPESHHSGREVLQSEELAKTKDFAQQSPSTPLKRRVTGRTSLITPPFPEGPTPFAFPLSRTRQALFRSLNPVYRNGNLHDENNPSRTAILLRLARGSEKAAA